MKQTEQERQIEVQKIHLDAVILGTGVAFHHADGRIVHVPLDQVTVKGFINPLDNSWDGKP